MVHGVSSVVQRWSMLSGGGDVFLAPRPQALLNGALVSGDDQRMFSFNREQGGILWWLDDISIPHISPTYLSSHYHTYTHSRPLSYFPAYVRVDVWLYEMCKVQLGSYKWVFLKT